MRKQFDQFTSSTDDIQADVFDNYDCKISGSDNSLTINIIHPESDGTVGKPSFWADIKVEGKKAVIMVMPEGDGWVLKAEILIPQGCPLEKNAVLKVETSDE